MVKEYLRLTETRKHLITGEAGAPRLYVMASCTNFIREMNGYVWKPSSGRVDSTNLQEKPVEKNDHLMDALKYLIQIPPKYQGSVLPHERLYGGRVAVPSPTSTRRTDHRTGY